MDEAGLLSLPVEVLYYISGYLLLEDILSCSLTCQYLRNVFNDNLVWKKYLPEQDTSKLESVKQHVQPVFQVNDGLTPLCDNRLHFMRGSRLLKNWREQNFVEFCSAEYSPDNNYAYYNQRAKGNVIYKDNYLFLKNLITDKKFHSCNWFIDVWDITDKPVLFTSIKLDNKYPSFNVVGSYLVVDRNVKVDVYLITIPEKVFPLAHSITIPEGQFGSCPHSVIDHYLVANSKSTIFEVWDIFNGSIIGSFKSPVDSSGVHVCSQVDNYWFLNQNSYYLWFDIENKLFSESFLKVDKTVISIFKYDSYLVLLTSARRVKIVRPVEWSFGDAIVVDDLECIVYDFNTFIELRRNCFNSVFRTHEISSADVVDGTFVLFSDNYFKVIDIPTLRVVSFEASPVYYIEKQLNVFGSVIVLTCDKKFWYELWDIQKKKKLPINVRENFNNCGIYFNQLCTKIALINNKKIRVLNFW